MNMKKKCFFYANCQQGILIKYLQESQEFINKYEIKMIGGLVHEFLQGEKKLDDNSLKEADLFIYQPVREEHGFLSSESVKNRLKPDCFCISFPSLYFTGYHPQYYPNPKIKTNHVYPFGMIYHGDRNIDKFLEQGYSQEELIKRICDENFYQEAELIDHVHSTLEELRNRENGLTIKVADFIESKYQYDYLFYTHNHPSDILGIYVVNQILSVLNMPSIKTEIINAKNGVLDEQQLPIYPSVIKHLKLKFISPKDTYKNSVFCTNTMTFQEYVEEYINFYQNIDNPSSAIYQHHLSIALENQNDWEAALIAQCSAIIIDNNRAYLFDRLAKIFLKKQRLENAIFAYEKAININKEWTKFYEILAYIYINKGDQEKQNENLDKAIIFYKKGIQYYQSCLDYKNKIFGALKIDNIMVDIHVKIADSLLIKQQIDEAKSYYQKAIDLNPNCDRAYIGLGHLLENQELYKDAAQCYRQAIKISSL
ncbi:WcbI family polysaccharide biosynthesis putative acetyltransferase [Planktothrix paucivesiculata]|uniref:Polysaccharide biosynthesis enzyme WcbI domain-containing protein n=1 Tax=Planktothrix paucivesiculata PCC 9631 TaxID=671071 RepID=A0A7Z9C0A8_9CYAN|nr:WcbI family polysaccharide biosynthesis putative acetyltransferase [Planktothrix paucivesiculata]VXD24938.1 hypothetical protein PL9631_900042 [Planktothrix paucivesiculata PCC 9631]